MEHKNWTFARAKCCTFHQICRTLPKRSRTRSTWTSSIRPDRIGSTAPIPTCAKPEPELAMLICRDPAPALRPFVTTLWASEQQTDSEVPASGRELMLPTGLMHVAFRLSDSAFRVLDNLDDLAGLPMVRGLHPVVACALERFAASTEVREVVRQSGYSHRRFIALFRRAAGLSPKTYCRVLRFRRAVERTFEARDASLADIALDVGYSDQPHFTREFRAFTGISPLQYRLASAVHANHVPIRISGNFVRGR